MDGLVDCHHRYWHLIRTNHCHWNCHRHNHNGIRHHYLHDGQLLFPELCHHSNYDIPFHLKRHLHFWENHLNCAWRHFSFKPLDFECVIFEDPATIFRLKIWRVCYCSTVLYTADVVCSFVFFFDDPETRC